MNTIIHTNPDFEGIKFCAKALDKDNAYHSMMFLHITDVLIEGTDGHRLHEYKPTDGLSCNLSPGLYRIGKNNKTFIELEKEENPPTYPNTSVVWPDYEATPSFDSKFGTDEMTSYAKLVRQLPEDITVNFHYMADIGEDFTCYPMDGKSPIVCQHGFLRALVMPMKMY